VLASGFNSPLHWPILDIGNGQFATNTDAGLTIFANGGPIVSYTLPQGAQVVAYLGNGVFAGMTSVPAPAVSGAGTTGAEPGVATVGVPALIDINAGTVTPITSPFLDVGFESPTLLFVVGAITS
jgi:hypothetical protein